jgi:hypothetical protein
MTRKQLHILSLPPIYQGSALLALCTIGSAFGNSLEPVAVLVVLQLLLSLVTFDWLMDGGTGNFATVGLITLAQGIGSTMAFAGTFSFPTPNLTTISITFIFCLLLCLSLTVGALLPQYLLHQHLGDTPFTRLYTFPVLFGACSTCVRSLLGSYTSIAVPFTDIEPLYQLASLFGVYTIELILCLFVTHAYAHIRPSPPPLSSKLKRHSLWALCSFFAVLTLVGSRDHLIRFYQHDLSNFVYPTLRASCLITENTNISTGSHAAEVGSAFLNGSPNQEIG